VLKRLFDIASSFLGLILVSPVLIVLALLIKIEDGGPVFYRGVRVGRYGKPFKIFKFRTMIMDAEQMGGSSTADDDPRLTKIGKRLRACKLDELPQLINVLKGEMSLVGPRPQVQWAVNLYTPEEREVLALRPGITDYASLHFPNEGEILKGSTDPDRDYMEKIHREKMRLAIEYVKTHSFWTDMKIIFQTIAVVFKH
jgi:lipopolysaccharide/colanic/teichoic acid biosynthesis glycosyltransferase